MPDRRIARAHESLHRNRRWIPSVIWTILHDLLEVVAEHHRELAPESTPEPQGIQVEVHHLSKEQADTLATLLNLDRPPFTKGDPR